MPGCLGLDALWQMVGFFPGLDGAASAGGRALGVDEVKFTGMVLPTAKKNHLYRQSQARHHARRLVLGIADGIMKVDGKVIYEAKGLRGWACSRMLPLPWPRIPPRAGFGLARLRGFS